jgi:hypothetical protein
MDAAATVNTAYVPSWPILNKLDMRLLKHDWQRILDANRDRARDQRKNPDWRLAPF